MSSTRDGSGGAQAPYAAENSGGGTVKSDFAMIRGTGDYTTSGSSTFDPNPTNGHSGKIFLDPTRGKDNPPITSASLPLRQHNGGALVGSVDPNLPRIVTDGIHFPTFTPNNGTTVATGNTLDITGHVKFEPIDGKFGEFIFPGGVDIKGANTNVEFGPGRYVFAGTKLKSGKPAPVFQMHANAVVTDNLAYDVKPANGGEMLIFAGPDYEGANGVSIQNAISNGVGLDYGLFNEMSAMSFGTAELKGGNSPGTEINLHGLNPENTNVPAELTAYKSTLAWQDRENSIYEYGDDLGNYNTAGCDGAVANPACNTGRDPDATELEIGASPDVHLWGVIYQPRGSFTTMIGGGGYSGPIQLVSGALRIQGNAQLNMGIISNPLTIKTISLIE